MPKVGGRRKKTRTHVENNEELSNDIPRSLIMRRGRVGPYIRTIIKELRATMYPYTAINLKESKRNNIKDFLSLVDIYGLSHMMIFTNTEKASYMKLAKLPAGPTITFKIDDFCLVNDVLSSMKKSKPILKDFNQVPLVIMNNFNDKVSDEYEEAVKISGMLVQSFFPPINVSEIEINKCKRAILFNLNTDTEEPSIEFRHYKIEKEKNSIKKTISNLLNLNKKDLSKFNNISDYVLKASGYTSCSDMEEPNLGVLKENDQNSKVKVKMYECGPRLNLKVHKIEEGFLKGNVVYHRIIKKSRKEIKEMMDSVKEKKKIKRDRIKEQKINMKVKEDQMLLKEIKEQGDDGDENEEDNQELIEKKLKALKRDKEKKNKLLNRKRKKEVKKDELEVIPKKELRQIQNMKKGKK